MEGLDIAVLPVEMHDEVGHGSTFYLLLPDRQPKSAALPEGAALLKVGQDTLGLAGLKKLSCQLHGWAKRAELR